MKTKILWLRIRERLIVYSIGFFILSAVIFLAAIEKGIDIITNFLF